MLMGRACRRDAEAEGHAVVERLDHALAAIARDVLVTLPALIAQIRLERCEVNRTR